MLQDADLDNQAKEDRIRDLQRSLNRKATCSPSARRSKAIKVPQSRERPVVDDSQPGRHRRSTSCESILSDYSSEVNLSKLIPATPKKDIRDIEVSHVTYSSRRLSSRDGTTATEVQQAERGASRESLSRSNSQVNKSSHSKVHSGLSSQRSESDISAPSRPESKTSPQKSDHAQRTSLSQTSGSIPRGILKPSTQHSRGEKRNAAETNEKSTAGFTASKRRKTDMTRDLGPIVQDSQSPMGMISGRARKAVVTKKKRGEGNPKLTGPC